MGKRIICLLLCIVMVLPTVTFVYAQEDIVNGELTEKTGTTNLAGETNANLGNYSAGIARTYAMEVGSGQYFEYIINTEAEQEYMLFFRMSSPLNGAYVDVYVNDVKAGNNVLLPTTANYDTLVDVSFGIVCLKAGKNTVKFERKANGVNIEGQTNIASVRRIILKRVDEDIKSESTEFPLNKSTTSTGGFWNPNDKNLSLWKNGWFEYSVNTLADATYYLSLYMGSVRDDATASVYVNGNCVLKDFKVPNTGNKNKPEAVNAGLINLSAGLNTIKMVRNANAAVDDTVCVHKFTLDREDIPKNAADFVLNSATVSKYGTVSINSYDVALWQNGWFEYNITTQKEGMFNIFLGAGTTLETSSVDVFVNGELVIDDASVQCTSADTDVYSNKLGSVNLVKGKNTIKIMRTNTGLASGYISARKLTLALPVDSYAVTQNLGVYDSATSQELWIAKSGQNAYGSIEIKKYGSVDEKFYVITAGYSQENELLDLKMTYADLSLMSDGQTKTFSTESIGINDNTACVKAFMMSLKNLMPASQQIEIYNPNLVEKNKNVFVNIAADGFETNVLKKSPNATEDVYRENVRNYVMRYLNNTPTGRLSFNVCYKRSVVDSEVFDSVLYNVELDENGVATKDDNGNSIKTKIDASTSTAMLSYYRDVIERDIDVIEMAITATKECGADAWLSLRMNDNHYNEDPNFNSMLSYGRAEELGVNGKRVNLDFTKQPVQNYYLEYIKELCQNYDIDGIELDFLRAGPYMTTVNADTIAELTSFVKKIRDSVNEIAVQKNKTIELAARVYADEEENLKYGIDAVQWIADGSIDILATGAYYIPTYYKIPIEKWKQSIDIKNTGNNKYSLLASADWAVRCDMTAKSGYMMWITLEQLKGFASSNYQKGADGIYLFNHFSTSDSGSTTYYVDANGNMTKKEILADKLMGLDSIDSAEKGLRVYVDTDKYTDRSLVYPKKLTNSSYTVKLNTGRSAKTGYYTVVIGIDNLDGYEENNFTVTVNGKTTTQIGDVPKKSGFNWKVSTETQPVARHVSETAPRVMQFKVNDLSTILDGENTIVVTNGSQKPQIVKWLEIHVDSTSSAVPVEAIN